MVFQDPTGALNPRQTIYEIVAEGLRIQHGDGVEQERVAQALPGGSAPTGAVLSPISTRGVGGSASSAW